MMKFTFYISEKEEEKEIEEVQNLLKKSSIPYDLKFLNKIEEEKLKFNVLIPIAVSKRIKIRQTKRTKSLYPQLVIFYKDRPVTFYPQSYGKKEIKIKEFLTAFLNKKLLCLHEISELKKFDKKVF